jgi:hypothetical protein
MQMHVKCLESMPLSHDDPSSNYSSSRGDDLFLISPCPRWETKKSSRRGEASSSQAANMDVGCAAREAREKRASDEIHKVERPLQADYEYTLRRVDRQHPHRATDFTLWENQSMVNGNENPFDWTTELHDHHFWNNFQTDWYLIVIKERKNPITPLLYVDWTYMQQKRDPVFNKVIAKVHSLGIFDILGMYQDWNTELVA